MRDSISALHKKFQLNESSVVNLVKSQIANCEENKNLNAFITDNFEDSLKRAKESDLNFRNKSYRPLEGVTFAVKDLFCTLGLRTTAGSEILSEFVPEYDATLISRIKENGGIILGKTNMDEFGMGSANSNSFFGQTWHPQDKNKVPGGSSGGSAVAVAKNMSCVALGTDTGGSVRQPASFCGVIGMKPTYGRLSRHGMISFASSFDTVGIFANYFEDLKTVLQVFEGKDDYDSTSRAKDNLTEIENPRFTFLDLQNVKEFCKQEAFDSFEVFTKKNRNSFELSSFSIPFLKESLLIYHIISTTEAWSNLAKYDGMRYGKKSDKNHLNLEGTYFANRDFFGPEVKKRIIAGSYFLSQENYGEYLDKVYRGREKFRAIFEEIFQKSDFFIMPTTTGSAFEPSEINEKIYFNDIYTNVANLLGLPAISIPILEVNGLPFGVQIVGRQNSDFQLIEVAKRIYEANT